MKPDTVIWVDRAESDFAMLEHGPWARNEPSYDRICFYAQQCVEKYLKARIREAGVSHAKVHDLITLLEQVLDAEPEWEKLRKDLAYLSEFALHFHDVYRSTKEEALEGQRLCRIFRAIARKALGLKA